MPCRRLPGNDRRIARPHHGCLWNRAARQALAGRAGADGADASLRAESTGRPGDRSPRYLRDIDAVRLRPGSGASPVDGRRPGPHPPRGGMDSLGPSDEAPTSRGLAAGERAFGRFRLLRRVGQGGMGEVWLARDERLDCDVALKFLHERYRWDEVALLALRTETRRTREMNHPGIVRIHDLHEGEGQAAIAMEFLPGGSLHARRCRADPPVFSPAEILVWLPQLCAALDHAHGAGVVHRDLKPSNLLLAADGGVKIGDFGIAQPLAESALRISQWAPSGTLAYMGPQQHFGEPPAPSDDIYSLGATLYELLTGKPPFFSGNLAAQIERRVPDSLVERRRQLGLGHLEAPSPAWEQTIAACLAKRPEDRPRTAREVVERLTSPQAAAGPSLPGLRRPWRALRVRSVRLGLLAVGLGAALVLLRSGAEDDGAARPGAVAPAAGAAPARAAPEAHPSDATRAWAAWNLDGDGRDCSGRGLNFESARSVPTTDRFGRIDRAVRFNGTAMLFRSDLDFGDWSVGEPFSVALWAKVERVTEDPYYLVALRSGRQEGPVWSLEVAAGRLRFTFGLVHIDEPQHVATEGRVAAGQWMHVAATSDGRVVRVFLDGRLVGEKEVRMPAGARSRSPGTFMLAGAHKFDPNRLVGSLDEVRIWRRAVSADEVARLATKAEPPRFRLTRAVYPAEADLTAAVAGEYGAAARIADWEEIARWHADDTSAWCDEVPLQLDSVSVFVQRDGVRYPEGRRHYFVNRFQGRRPPYYKVHAELGGMVLALGSWHGVMTNVLAALPPASIRKMPLSNDGVTDVALAPLTRALSLEWQGEVRPGTAPMVVEFTTRAGGSLAASIAPGSAPGYLAVALGDPRRPGRSLQVVASYGDLRLQVVVRDGRLLFRAVTTVGEAVVFQEDLEAVGAVSDLVSVTLRGIDSAGLTVEE
jgi:hypothetical protein